MTLNILSITQNYLIWLYLCFTLFLFRVTAQLIQKFYNLPFLLPFNAWYSGVLPYHWLLLFQVIIIFIMLLVIRGFRKNTVKPKRQLGFWLLVVGSIYFIVMAFRLIAGFTFGANHTWLAAHIPAFFHIVLASFIFLTGHYHYKYANV